MLSVAPGSAIEDKASPIGRRTAKEMGRLPVVQSLLGTNQPRRIVPGAPSLPAVLDQAVGTEFLPFRWLKPILRDPESRPVNDDPKSLAPADRLLRH